jgi:hypothetical protein
MKSRSSDYCLDGDDVGQMPPLLAFEVSAGAQGVVTIDCRRWANLPLQR